MVFQQKLWETALNLIFKLTGRAKVRPASSDKWKAPFPFFTYAQNTTVEL